MENMVSKRYLRILNSSVYHQDEMTDEQRKAYNLSFYKRNSSILKLVQPDSLDCLLKDPISNNYHSDVWLLTQKERLASVSAENLTQLISTRFAQRKTSPRLDVGDDVLFNCIVSRRFDSPSEKMAYLNLLETELGVKSDELRELLSKENISADNKTADTSVTDNNNGGNNVA